MFIFIAESSSSLEKPQKKLDPDLETSKRRKCLTFHLHASCYLILLNFRGFLNSRFSQFQKVRKLKDSRKISTANFDLAKFNGHRKIKTCVCVFKGPKQFLTQGVSTRSYYLSTSDANQCQGWP